MGEEYRPKGTGYPVVVGSCPICRWSREVDQYYMENQKRYFHPIYGDITYYAAAMRDVESHRCRTYRAAKMRARDSAYQYNVRRRTWQNRD